MVRGRMERRRLIFGLFLVAACGTPSAGLSLPPRSSGGLGARASEATPKASRTPSAEPDSLAIFERMVSMVRRYHLFAPQTEKNLRKSWEADLPRLRAEFVAAKDKDALTVALFHFGNSLHDVHCVFRPKNRGERIKLGFRVDVEIVAGQYQFYVDRVRDESLRAQIKPGDIVVAVDGVPAAKLVEEYDLLSNSNSRDNIAIDIANALTARRTALTSLRAGMTSTFTLRARQGGDERVIRPTWKKGTSSDDSDFALDYASKDCVNADPREYGAGYALTARGYRICIYASTEPKYRDYPIIRQVSFRYDEIQYGPLADFDLLSRTLAAAKPKGILLDVQDNGGGINPNLFIEWWTDKPYTDTETHMLLDETLVRDKREDVHISSVNDAVQAWYAGELKTQPSAASGDSGASRHRMSSARPFMCKADTCAWDNHYAPGHRATKAPVALLLGPGCASSCDAFAWHFDKADTGPIIGRGAMAGFTTHRARFDVTPGEGQAVLGTIDFAISYDTPPGGTESIEGVSVNVDVPIPRTFDNHDRYDRLLIDGAIQALTTWKQGIPSKHP